MDSKTLQKDTDILCVWANRWQVEFNIAKRKTAPVLGSRNRHQVCSMNSQKLEEITSEQDFW